MSTTDAPTPLAPLQEVMLRDSLSAPRAGYHVEQVEIIFKRKLPAESIATAWEDTVSAVEVLRTSFGIANGIPAGCHPARVFPLPEIHDHPPGSWETWRESDRCRPILFPDTVPWRIALWPSERRFLWTFHHALLDGRSISRVLRVFLSRLDGGGAPPLPASRWQPPSAEAIALATGAFRRMRMPPGKDRPGISDEPPGPALRCMGNGFLTRMDSLAREMRTSVATLVTWTWGQAHAEISGRDSVLVEQVRAGAPQPGTAGFTMNVLPVVIGKSGIAGLPDFQAALHALRGFESVSAADFPPGVFPDVDAPGTSTIMVEHATLPHAVGSGHLAGSVLLHERGADFILATAHLQPDFQLKVEGPLRHSFLAAWSGLLENLARGIRGGEC